MAIGKSIKNSAEGLNWLLVVGFLGIVWLMIYGNLQTVRYSQLSARYPQDTVTITDAGVALTSASGLTNPVVSSVVVINSTGDGTAISSGNYTVTGITLYSTATSQYNDSEVNVSYTVSYDSQAQIDSDAVITNMTTGTKVYYGFMPTLFTIMAIILLITILLALLAIVMHIVHKGKGNSKESYSSE
jgi:hypothetical protein